MAQKLPEDTCSKSAMSLPLFSGFDYDFLIPLDSKYECAICLLAIRKPTQTACGHRFCRDCIMSYLNGCNKQCPIDKQPLSKNDLFHDSCIEREILQLKVKCPNCSLGCNSHIDLKYIEDHIQACSYQPVLCPNECSITVLQNELENHLTSQCLYRLVSCNYCKSPYVFTKEQLHLTECPQVSVSCELCGIEMFRDKVADHKKETCSNVEIACIYAEHGCQHKATRTDMKNHMGKCVEYHMQLLATAYKKINALVLDLYRNFGHVANNSNFSRNPSFRSQLSTSSTYENMNFMQTDKNIENSTIGAFATQSSVPGSESYHEKGEWDIGDEAKELQQSLLNHDYSQNDCEKGDKKELKTAKNFPESACTSSSSHTKLLRDLSNRSVDIDQRVLEDSIKMVNISKRIDAIENGIMILSKEFNKRFCNGVFVWKIPDFLQIMKNGKILHSLPFYSSPFGYKFCLRINVDIASNESYLSLYIHMMQGENDDFLDWPFRGKISWQILDCGDSIRKHHVTETMDIAADMEVFKRPRAVRSVRGYGFRKFISLDQIINPGPGCFYLKNDFLYIRATVTEARV